MSTEFSAFAPPSLASAAPSPLPPPLPTTTASLAPTAPAAVEISAPSLPTLPLVAPAPHVLTAPATPAPPPAPPTPAPASDPFPAPAPAAAPAPAPAPAALPVSVPAPPVEAPTAKKSPRRHLTTIIGVALLAGAGVLAYSAVSGSDDAATPTPAERTTDAAQGEADIEPASPILVPINDAENVVDEINDRAEEAELLEQLGLDPNGRPIPPGYRFVTTDPLGASLSIQVDTTTGNYSVESPDGFAFRSIDGATVARDSAIDAWTPVDATQIDDVQRFGLDRLVAESDLITSEINPWVSVVDRTSVDGRETTRYSIDVVAIQAEQPGALAEWAAPFGLDADAVVTAASAPVSIDIVVNAQRTVQGFTIDAPGADGTVSYRLETVYDAAPVISL